LEMLSIAMNSWQNRINASLLLCLLLFLFRVFHFYLFLAKLSKTMCSTTYRWTCPTFHHKVCGCLFLEASPKSSINIKLWVDKLV
jgi:hypothetical protein